MEAHLQSKVASMSLLVGLDGGILSVTEVIFVPHFQNRVTVQQVANKVGFREVGFFGKKLAYTMHFEKLSTKSNPIDLRN